MGHKALYLYIFVYICAHIFVFVEYYNRYVVVEKCDTFFSPRNLVANHLENMEPLRVTGGTGLLKGLYTHILKCYSRLVTWGTRGPVQFELFLDRVRVLRN